MTEYLLCTRTVPSPICINAPSHSIKVTDSAPKTQGLAHGVFQSSQSPRELSIVITSILQMMLEVQRD